MQKTNLKWKFPDAKIEQNWCETMFSGYWFFPELQVGYLKKNTGVLVRLSIFFGNNCQFCIRVGFQIPWSVTICYMVFKIIKK
jgi:hypothetical protein